MAIQTAAEQFILELLNRARLDPGAEAARYGFALNEGVPAVDTITTAAKQPLGHERQARQSGAGPQLGDDQPGCLRACHRGVKSTKPDRGPRLHELATLGENIAWNGSTGPWPANQANVEAAA